MLAHLRLAVPEDAPVRLPAGRDDRRDLPPRHHPALVTRPHLEFACLAVGDTATVPPGCGSLSGV